MSFLDFLFNRKEENARSVVLIDIGSSSVAGAYAHYAEGELPSVLYTRRLPIEIHAGEPHATAMLRALNVLGDALIKEGAPALTRSTGSGSVDSVLVSVDAPWQETSVRTENFERAEPFVFTKKMVATALEKTGLARPHTLLADESIIGTTLNGYETHDPYGKTVRRASVVILTSFIDESVAKGIAAAIRSLYHTEDVMLISGNSLRYQAMRATFPHERDMLILDATDTLSSIALVRKDLFVALSEVAEGKSGTHAWIKKITDTFAELAEKYPLPRTIFLLARESEAASLRTALSAAPFDGLWLANNPPKVVSVLASHVVGLVRHVSAAPPDLLLLLMALYWQHCSSDPSR